MTLKRAIAATILTMSFVAPAAAGPYEEAIAAYNSGDYATALLRFRPLADQGDPAAQYRLGYMYERGQGHTQDLVLAYMWFDLSAVKLTPAALESRDFVATLMTADQIAKAEKLAREWKPKPE
jgi:uncharacterized protein